jgi:hypothetical protein
LYWIASQSVAIDLCAMATADGGPAHGGMSPLGGALLNLPCLVSDAAEEGELFLLAADSVCADIADVQLRASRNASVEMSEIPAGNSVTPHAVNLTSLFQSGSVGLLATVVWGAQKMRDNALVKIENAVWHDDISA